MLFRSIYKKEIKAEDFNNINITQREFISNRIDGVSKLKFLQYWGEQKDDLCEDMQVLQPSDLVFVGFKTKEE